MSSLEVGLVGAPETADQTLDRKHGALRALIDAGTNQLLSGLASGSTRELAAYLALVEVFPRFSLFNHHLLFAQCPEASLLGEFEAWRDLGYRIARGSVGIRLLDGKTPITLFDISQTRPCQNAQIVHAFGAEKVEPFAFYEKLTAHLLSLGLIDPEDLTDVRPDSEPEGLMEEIEHFMRLYAEALLWRYRPTCIAKERIAACHAEAIAYIALKHLGLEALYGAANLEGWGRDPRALREDLELVRRISAMMIAEMATYPEAAQSGRKMRHIHFALA